MCQKFPFDLDHRVSLYNEDYLYKPTSYIFNKSEAILSVLFLLPYNYYFLLQLRASFFLNHSLDMFDQFGHILG